MIASTLARLVQNFFRLHLIAHRDLSANTIAAYRDAIRLFLTFLASRASCEVADLEIDDLTRDALLAFLDDLESSRGNSPSTRNARLAAIHAFFRFVAAQEPALADQCRQVLFVPYKRTAARTFTCLDREEVEQILASIDRSTPLGRRDAALLQLLYNTGARAQEVVDLRVPALRLDPPAQVRILGKGRKERLCPLWPETAALLRHTLKDRRISLNEDVPLFVNAAGRPLTRFGLRHIVRSRVVEAALLRPSLAKKKISPHTFRHTTALHLIQAGVELNVVRSWLGHASIETTHAYVEIDMQMKAAALQACAPPSTTLDRPSWRQPDLLTWLEAL